MDHCHVLETNLFRFLIRAPLLLYQLKVPAGPKCRMGFFLGLVAHGQFYLRVLSQFPITAIFNDISDSGNCRMEVL